MPSVYRASCILALGNFGDPIYTSQGSAAEIMLSDGFMLDLLEQLNTSPTPDNLRALGESIAVEPVKGSERLLEISVETRDPKEAVRIAEGIVILYASRSNQSYTEQREILMERLEATRQLLDSVEESLNQTRRSMEEVEETEGVSSLEKSLLLSYKLDYLQAAASQRLSLMDRYLDLQKQLRLLKPVEIVERPSEPLYPVRPKRTLIVAVAGMLGLMAGIFAAFLREGLEKTG
ncbi:MAG: GNVR domain-containing protein [Methanothrix sp.]|nr:GNVR domain-containing protein [Methanothrix sp.]